MGSDQLTEVQDESVKRTKGHEGPRNHIMAFIFSILLTALAFAAVLYVDKLETWFVYGFIVLLAIIQALVQLFYWMHLKDRGHLFMRIFIVGGTIAGMCAIVSALYWVWW